jgi:hypothetical protein
MPGDRQQLFVATFRRMSTDAQKALKAIYDRAHTDGSASSPENFHPEDGKEHHVVMAMRAATRFPDIFKFTMMNLATRVVLKMAEQAGNHTLAAKKRALLDDFHAALDEFCGEMAAIATLETPAHPEKSLSKSSVTDEYRPPYLWLMTDVERLQDIFSFKSRSTPMVAKVRHCQRSRLG